MKGVHGMEKNVFILNLLNVIIVWLIHQLVRQVVLVLYPLFQDNH